MASSLQAPAAPPAPSRRRVLPGLDSGALGWVELGVLLAVGAVLLLTETAGTTFYFDEWPWVVERSGGGVDTLLEPHNEHFSLVPVAIYKLLFATAGFDHYTPYRVVVTLAQLACVALVFEYMRRRVGPVLALAGAALILFLGPGWEVILWPFQVAWLISVGAGVGALLMLDREDRIGDVGACALVTISLASSGLGIAIAIGAVVEALARPRLRRRLWIVAIPVAFYFAWWIGYRPESHVTAEGLEATPRFVARSVASAVSALLGLGDFTVPPVNRTSTVMWVLAGAAVLALVWRLVALRRVPVRVLSLLAMVVSFWALTGASRALLLPPTVSRYVYVGAILVLLIACELARGVRVPSWATAALAAAALAAVVANLPVLQSGAASLRDEAVRNRARLGAVEIARPVIAAEYPVHLLGPFGAVKAGEYFEAADAHGSPAATGREIAAGPEIGRQAADRELINVYGIRPLPSPPARRPGGRPPAVRYQKGGRLVKRGGCAVLRAGPAGRSNVDVTVPPGGLLIDAAGGRPAIGLRRFSTTLKSAERLPAGDPRIITVPVGRPRVLRIPRDLAPRPWLAFVSTTRGSVAVCGPPRPPA